MCDVCVVLSLSVCVGVVSVCVISVCVVSVCVVSVCDDNGVNESVVSDEWCVMSGV